MEVKVLGLGCKKCKRTLELIQKVIQNYNLEASLVAVDNIQDMMLYDCCYTPAVVVDGVVVAKGYVPSEKEVKKFLKVEV